MIAKDGYPVIAYTGAVLILLLLLTMYLDWIIIDILAVLVGIVFVFNFYFLRDPERQIPAGDHMILSPADGTILKIVEVDEPLYFEKKVQMVSIFMSPLNVHVNRLPISGKVDYVDYQKGKYLAAFNDNASDVNEQSIIGVENDRGKVLFKQIAGVLARRIIYNLKVGDEVTAGDRFGLIRYGSRLDVFIPADAAVKVQLKEKVKAGETILAEFKS